jgi:hypothetical protein
LWLANVEHGSISQGPSFAHPIKSDGAEERARIAGPGMQRPGLMFC